MAALQPPHLAARRTIAAPDGVPQPAPAPRFSATPAELDRPPAVPGQHTDEVLAEWGWTSPEIAALHDDGAVVNAGLQA